MQFGTLYYFFFHARGAPLSHPHCPEGQLRSRVVGPEYVGTSLRPFGMSLHYIQKESKQALAHHLAWGTCPAQSHSSTQEPAGSNFSTACKSHDSGKIARKTK